MNYREYIGRDHKVMLGKPVIKGTRLTVELILRKLGEGASPGELLLLYPQLTEKHLQVIMQFAAELVANEDHISAAS
ncbi:MAG: antitoxin [Cytophagaceae bacterium SCN 52-12]|nr:MAG: antitoxin [Cytophagaceae bacterium SCN 52-12]